MKSYTKVFFPLIYIGVIAFMVMVTLVMLNGIQNFLKEDIPYKYALDGVFEDDIIPVMKTESDMIVRPYISNDVTVGKYFYDYESDNTKQEDAIIYYEDTYMQNTGVNYVSNDTFEVVAVLEGEVIGIEENDVYGNIITIKHNDNLITSYSNVEEVVVDMGYIVSQGEIIASSAVTDISEEKSMLHFEVMYKGEYIDPENLYTLKVSDIQ